MENDLSSASKEELISIVTKLRRKNAQLADHVSQMKCLVSKMDHEIKDEPTASQDEPTKKKRRSEAKVATFTKRKVAFRFSYDGRDFNGLQRSPVANQKVSVEDCLFNALIKCKLVESIGESDYIAGGRTDKGVHAVNNVFSIVVNSKLSEGEIEAGKTDGERDFVSILNRQLPDTIIVTAWAPVSFDFTARFSCKSRHYQYIFCAAGLDMAAMDRAAKKLVGTHDFRNFSQAQLERQDTVRECFEANVLPVKELPGLCVFSIKSSGFLYHQIRLTMTILALIGNGLESVDLVEELLDVNRLPRRPSYKYANPDGLVLIDCEYEGVNWVQGHNPRFSANKVDSRLYSMKIALAVQQRIKAEMTVGDAGLEMAHKKITGICEKPGSHKKILDYSPTPNAADLLLKKSSK